MKYHKPEFTRAFVYNLLLVIIIIVAVMDFIWIYQAYDDLDNDVKELRSNYIEKQKVLIRNEVHRINNYISYRRNIIMHEDEVNVQNKLNKIFYRISQYYNVNKQLPDSKLKDHIIQIISDDKTNLDRYYTLVYSYQNNLLTKEAFFYKKGSKRLIIKSSIANEIVENFKRQNDNTDYIWHVKGGRAYAHYDGEKLDYLRLGGIRYFKPLKLFVIVGTYAENISQKIQKDVLGWVDKLKFPPNQYFFIDRFDGTALVFDGKKVEEHNKNNVNPAFIKKYREETEKVINTTGRGYIYYSIAHSGKNQIYHKISYVQTIEDWEWIIGAGVYMENIESEINLMRQKLEIKTIYNISGIVLLLFAFIIISLLIARIIIKKAEKSFKAFYEFFGEADNKSIAIDPEKQTFKEFAMLAESVNSMLSKRLQAEEALKFSENRFRDIAESMADWIWEIDSSLKYKYVSGKIEKMLGVKPKDVVGKFYGEIYLKKCDKKNKEAFIKIIENEEKIEDFNVWTTNNKGERICLQTNAIPFYDKNNAFLGYRGISKDITDKVKALLELRKHKENLEYLIEKRTEELAEKQAQLVHSGRLAALGEMAAGMAHEINQPLGTIKFALNNIEMAIEEKELDYEYLKNKSKKVNAAVERIANIINHVRIFARQRSGKPVNCGPFVLKESIYNAIHLVGMQIKKNGIALCVDNIDKDIKVKGDTYKFEQIILNLLSNAKDAVISEKERNPEYEMKIVIFTEIVGDRINIIVKDNGIGIPKENYEKILNPFFTTKEAGEGTGLGLSITYGILKEMDGNITFKSDGNETLAIVSLPLMA